MTPNSHTELGEETFETGETPPVHEVGRLESLDDIPREIANRRLHAEFGADIAPERSELLRERPDLLERPEDFARTAKTAGLADSEGVLGWSTRPEDPAHVLKGDVGREIATLIHEDLHRATHPETLREIGSDPALGALYEGVTEHFTERAAVGLHGFQPGKVYPEEVETARRIAGEVGDGALRGWFFRNELGGEVAKTIRRLTENGGH
jgi:hypothetical protein